MRRLNQAQGGFQVQCDLGEYGRFYDGRFLSDAINSIIDVKEESDIDSLVLRRCHLCAAVSGLNDFEPICFLVVRDEHLQGGDLQLYRLDGGSRLAVEAGRAGHRPGV